MSLLVLNNICKEYRNQTVLDGASLRIERGERVALVGPNGSGKTTLLRIAAGKESCDSGNVILARGAKMGYLTQDLKELDKDGRTLCENALFHEEVSRLEQKMRSLEKAMAEPHILNDPTAYEAIASEYSRLMQRFESLDGYAIESKIKAMLFGLGLKEEALALPLEQLSGGEKMRVAFARVLLEEPDLLVLDEPTNHLDIEAVEWLEGFLKKFPGGVLVVSHDRYFLDQVATRVAELGNGTIVERSGNYSTFMEQKNRMMAYAQKEQNRLKEEIKREATIADQLKSAQRISAWKSRMKKVERLKQELDVTLNETREQHHLHRTVAPRLSMGHIKHVSAEIAMAHNLSKSFGQVQLFSQVSFLITGGEKVGIIGPNGCGKTTLLNILLGKDKDFTGQVRLGEWVRYGYLGQELAFENDERTILEELLSVREMTEDEALNYLARYQFYGDEVDKRIGVLSGGEKVRVRLACMMLENPDCLIMDEPTNHLDIPARDALESALLEFKGTLIAISHDRYFLNRCVNRILEFSHGGVSSYQGNYARYKDIKAQAQIQMEVKGVPARRLTATRKERPYETRKRQETSRLKAELVKTEARITELEGLKKSLEDSFGIDTPPEKYVEYESILKELEDLYQFYLELETV